MDIIMYTTHCPQCKVLGRKLDNKGVKYTVVDNVEVMVELGIKAAPALSVDGTLMNFKESVNWINALEV